MVVNRGGRERLTPMISWTHEPHQVKMQTSAGCTPAAEVVGLVGYPRRRASGPRAILKAQPQCSGCAGALRLGARTMSTVQDKVVQTATDTEDSGRQGGPPNSLSTMLIVVLGAILLVRRLPPMSATPHLHSTSVYEHRAQLLACT